jgi:hypothetical protein
VYVSDRFANLVKGLNKTTSIIASPCESHGGEGRTPLRLNLVPQAGGHQAGGSSSKS